MQRSYLRIAFFFCLETQSARKPALKLIKNRQYERLRTELRYQEKINELMRDWTRMYTYTARTDGQAFIMEWAEARVAQIQGMRLERKRICSLFAFLPASRWH